MRKPILLMWRRVTKARNVFLPLFVKFDNGLSFSIGFGYKYLQTSCCEPEERPRWKILSLEEGSSCGPCCLAPL